MEAAAETENFDLEIFNVSGEPEDIQITFDEEFAGSGMEAGGRRC